MNLTGVVGIYKATVQCDSVSGRLVKHLFCFRSIISNQAMGEEDIDFMLVELDRLGIDL